MSAVVMLGCSASCARSTMSRLTEFQPAHCRSFIMHVDIYILRRAIDIMMSLMQTSGGAAAVVLPRARAAVWGCDTSS